MTKRLRDYKAIIFDFDDTLVDTIGPIWKLHKFVAKHEFGKSITDDDIRAVWGKPLQVVVTTLYGEPDEELAVSKLIEHKFRHPKTALPGAIDLIHTLQVFNLPLGLLTAGMHRNIPIDFKNVGLELEWFDHIQASEDTKHHKPDPRVFNPTLEKFAKDHGIAPSEMVYIADGVHDHAAATGAGLDFIGVASGLVELPEFERNGIYAVTDISEIII